MFPFALQNILFCEVNNQIIEPLDIPIITFQKRLNIYEHMFVVVKNQLSFFLIQTYLKNELFFDIAFNIFNIY